MFLFILRFGVPRFLTEFDHTVLPWGSPSRLQWVLAGTQTSERLSSLDRKGGGLNWWAVNTGHGSSAGAVDQRASTWSLNVTIKRSLTSDMVRSIM